MQADNLPVVQALIHQMRRNLDDARRLLGSQLQGETQRISTELLHLNMEVMTLKAYYASRRRPASDGVADPIPAPRNPLGTT